MDQKTSNEMWYYYLMGEWRIAPTKLVRLMSETGKITFGWLPSEPHCFECGIPLAGIGSKALWFMGAKPSSFSSRLCIRCETSARKYESGAEVELTLLFADVRDSTPLAEVKGVTGFKEIINRFYKETSEVLIRHNAMVNRLMGDQVIALFVPRFAGKDHAQAALRATRELLRVTGHGDPNGPWIPVGAGIHTGVAYVGAVGSANGVNEIAVLGSAANLCARLSSKAAAGEILISEDSVESGKLDVSGLETRLLELKGVGQPVLVRVMKA
jgi:adenylate cyclase